LPFIRGKSPEVDSQELNIHLNLLEPCATERTQPERLARCLDDDLDDGGEDGGLLKLDGAKDLNIVRE